MKTIGECYRNDNEFRYLVAHLEALISKGTYTPSELRKALILAQTNYEMYRLRPMNINTDVDDALKVISDYIDKEGP